MSNSHTHPMQCEHFFDQLEHWLAGELDSNQQALMQAHHDSCEECRLEARLACEISAAMKTLPELARPPHLTPAPARQPVPEPRDNLISRLLAAWREPLVMVPAFVLLLAIGIFLSVGTPTDNTTNPDLVVINGQEYTQEEIIQAAQDLELALRYLDKYGSYPARVVTTELQQPYLPITPRQEPGEADGI